MVSKLMDPNTTGYDRWCELAASTVKLFRRESLETRTS